MRNLLSGLVAGVCLVTLWAVLTKPKQRGDEARPGLIGRLNGQYWYGMMNIPVRSER